MPYTSLAQERFFHTPAARAAGITPDEVKEYDDASRGRTLPARAKGAKRKKPRLSPLHEAILTQSHG